MRVSLKEHTRQVMEKFSQPLGDDIQVTDNVIQDVFAALEAMVVGVELVREDEFESDSALTTIKEYFSFWNILHVGEFIPFYV